MKIYASIIKKFLFYFKSEFGYNVFLMSTANTILLKVIEIGPVILIPLILLLIGFVTTRNPLKNLLNSFYVFAGMMGMAIMLTLFVNFFEPLIKTIVASSGRIFIIPDAGWLASKEVILNSPITLYAIIAIAALNLVMLLLRLTRTINIDLWNWSIFLFAGSMVFAITEIRWLGILATGIICAITLVIGDIYAPYIENFYGLKGISNPQTQTVIWAPVSHLVNGTFNRIPGVRRVHVFYEEIQHKLGIFSEPMILGFILGFITGLITKYREFSSSVWPNILYALGAGLGLAVIMILMPRFVNIMYKGLYPAVNNIKDFISRRITKRELYIGVDSIVFAGHPAVIGLSVIIIPLSTYIATILPGNKILPGADLILIPFILVWAIAPSRGDIFRSFISAMIIVPLTLWISSDMSNLFVNFFAKYGIEFTESVKGISSYGAGSNWLFWILLQILKPLLNLFT